jgi:hypothetical protein
MQKDKILIAYDVDNAAYLGTCKAIGLQNPDELKGQDLVNFEMVRDWWKAEVVKNHADAAKKFREWQEAQVLEEEESALPPEILAILKENAVESMQSIPDIVRVENSATLSEARKAFRKYQMQYAQSPEFQQLLADAIDCEVMEDQELPGESHYPALLEQSVSSSS